MKTRREVKLKYDQAALDCNQPRAPLRLITKIRETVWDLDGIAQDLPVILIDYGSPERILEAIGKLSDPLGGLPHLGDGYRHLEPQDPGGWPTTQSTLLDLDGDGFLDWLSASNLLNCDVKWYRGNGASFLDEINPRWPTLPWRNGSPSGVGSPSNGSSEIFSYKEGCSISYQLSRRETPVPGNTCQAIAANYSAFRLIDINGDGVVELLSGTDYPTGKFNPLSDLTTGGAAVFYADRYGGAPTCPEVPLRCQKALDGEPALCDSINRPLISLFSETESGTSNVITCPNNQCAKAGCSCSGCSTPEDVKAACCSEETCNTNDKGLTDSILSRRMQGNGGTSFFGPLFEEGDVGKETDPGNSIGENNVLCAYIAEHCFGENGTAAAYVWRKYDLLRNLNSSPRFSEATLSYSPIPLESVRATAAMGGNPASSFQAIVDIDGDGCVDALFEWPQHRNGDGSLQVWRGDCKGGFMPRTDGKPWIWQMPTVRHALENLEGEPSRLEFSSARTLDGPTLLKRRATEVAASLTDINGDGLPDYVVQDWTGTDPDHNGVIDRDPILRVFFNTGTGFEIKSTVLSDAEAVEGVQNARILKTMSEDTSVVLKEFPPTKDLEIGWSKSTLRPFDFDYDGMVDVAQLAAPMADQINPWSGTDKSVIVHVNHGDRLRPVASSKLTQQWHDGLSHITLSNKKHWRVASDARDLNNDGLPDNFPNTGESPATDSGCNPQFDSPETLSPDGTYSFCGLSRDVFGDKKDAAGVGLRFLRSINNGRGAIVRFNYGTSGDPGLVKREAGSLVPNPLWVVRSVTVEPGKTASGEAALPSTTSYTYLFPVVNEDSRGHFGFRGFKQVEVLGPENATHQQARTVERYDYALDYSGRPTERLIFDQAGKLYSIDATTWKEANLFDEAVKIHLATDSRTYTCDSKTQALPTESQEADCKTRGALKRTTRNYRPKTSLSLSETGLVAGALPSGGVVGNEKPNTIMYVLRGERLTDSVGGVAVDDRGTVFGETVVYSQDRYQLLPTDTRLYRATQNSWKNPELVGRTQIIYDGSGHGTPSKTSVWRTTTEVATTITEYDATTGNLKRTQKPKFNGTDLWTVTSYTDPFRIFPTEIRNEKGHLLGQKFDPHTGQVIRRENPKQSSGIPVELMRYDGLGRLVRVDRTTDPGFTVRQIRSVEYDDTSIPNKVITRQKLDHAENTWVTRDATYDGLGRPITERLQVDLTTWAGSSYGYDGAGHLVSFTTPSATGVGNEIYRYQHDALGRIILSDAPGIADWTFKYDGLKGVREQVVTLAAPPGTVPMPGLDGSVAMTVQTVNDVFGRLREVTELRNGPNAVTTYSYDANDHLTKIVDADGIKTDLTHNFVGNRIAVERAGRTWSYGYDLNGNLNVETTPHTELPDQFISTWNHDELDRLIEHNPAQRGLTAESERYSLGRTTYIYDDSSRPNGIGRLTTVKLPFGSVIYDYTAEGWVEREQRAFSIKPAGFTLSDNREVFQTFNALGGSVLTKHADGTTSTIQTYDFADRPLAVYVGSIAFENKLAQFDRNLAGLPTTRFSRYAQGQSWTYDELGRVTDHASRRCPNLTVVTDEISARNCAKAGTTVEGGETLVWLEAGNVRSVLDRRTGVSIEYRYDSQHQITAATSSDALTYAANFVYTPGGRIRRVTAKSISASILSRDVAYLYDDNEGSPMTPRSDPAAVRELRPDAVGEPIGVFSYDLSGNLVNRTYSNQSHQFIYDGSDQLREVIQTAPTSASEIYYYHHTGQRVLAYSSPVADKSARLRFWFGATELDYAVGSSPGTPTWSQVFAYLGANPAARIAREGTATSTHLLYSGVLGSLLTVLLADVVINETAAYGYGAFGERLYSEGATSPEFRRLFSGKEHDELTGISYYGYRYYDPVMLQWTQSDPLYRLAPEVAGEEPRRLAPYTFALNNPLKYVDPDGRQPKLAKEQKIQVGLKEALRVIKAMGELGRLIDGQFLDPESELRVDERIAREELNSRVDFFANPSRYFRLSERIGDYFSAQHAKLHDELYGGGSYPAAVLAKKHLEDQEQTVKAKQGKLSQLEGKVSLLRKQDARTTAELAGNEPPHPPWATIYELEQTIQDLRVDLKAEERQLRSLRHYVPKPPPAEWWEFLWKKK